jgi:PiT family inorganic phosphate transporter
MEAVILAILVFVALVFDFLNGMNDAANSIATVVSTRVLSPRAAVVWAAFFNFVAAWILTIPASALVAAGTYWLIGSRF